jgi:hypothetical protein
MVRNSASSSNVWEKKAVGSAGLAQRLGRGPGLQPEFLPEHQKKEFINCSIYQLPPAPIEEVFLSRGKYREIA